MKHQLIKTFILPFLSFLTLYSCNNGQLPYQYYKDPITSAEVYKFKDGREIYRFKDEHAFEQALQRYVDDSGSIYKKKQDREGLERKEVDNSFKHYRVNITDFTSSGYGELRVYPNEYFNGDSSINIQKASSVGKSGTDFVIMPVDEQKYAGWVKHVINDVGFIYTPTDYTFYDEHYYDSISKQLQPDASSIGVIMQKIDGTDFLKITIAMKIGRSGTAHKLSNEAYKFEPVTIEDYETIIKPTMIAPNKAAGMEILETTPVKEDTLNGMFCLGFSLTAMPPDHSVVIGGKFYWINNGDRVHQINMSYTANFYKRNKQVVDKILSSFRITNIQ